MTDRDAYLATLVNLVEGRLDPAEWDAWWAAHGSDLLVLLNPGQALRFRLASQSATVLARIASCQVQAAELLESWGITASLNLDYSTQAHREVLSTIKALRKQAASDTATRRSSISRLEGRFPAFAAFLRRRGRDLQQLGPPATETELQQLSLLTGRLPPSLRDFLLCTRSLRLGDLIQFDIDGMMAVDFSHLPEPRRPSVHGMVLLCEFWFEADGDQLILNQHARAADECPILYYAHEHRPPRVTTVASTFDQLLEWWAQGPKAWERSLGSKRGTV